MAKIWDNIKNYFTDTRHAGGAGVEWGKSFLGKGEAVLNGGNKVGGGIANVAGKTLKRADSLVAKTFNNPVTGGILMVAAAVALWHGAKRLFGAERKQKEIKAVRQQADAIEAQNQQMVQDYSAYHNPHAKTGHVAGVEARRATASEQSRSY